MVRKEREIKTIYALVLAVFTVFLAVPIIRLLMESFLGEAGAGIGNYVAIPHGKSDSVTQVGIAIGKVEDEIAWETLDGKGVKLIFLFAVGNDNENARTHLKLLAEVARTLGNDDAVQALLAAETVEDLKAVF